jgi:signal transduction histidine kinase
MTLPAISESAATIGEQSERITRIIRRILDYARRRPARRAWLDPADVVQQACALLRGLAEQRNVALDVVEPNDKVRLHADPDQLQQAVTNLVLNAVHVSPSQERVRIVLELVNRVRDSECRGFVAISVHDAGPGVSEDVRGKIFEPFFTTKSPGEGTGLGLSVVKDIVEDHGGSIEVEPGLHGGSVFTIYLPRSAPDVD